MKDECMRPRITNINKAHILQPREQLIDQIENLLVNAKSGELTGMAAVSIWQGGNLSYGWSLPPNPPIRTILGELDFLRHRLIDDEIGRE